MSRKIRAKSIADRRFILFEGMRYNLARNPESVSSVVKSKSSLSNRYKSVISSLSPEAKFYLFQGVYSLAELNLRLREVDNFNIYVSSMLDSVVDPTHDVFSALKADDRSSFISAMQTIGADSRKKAFLSFVQGVYFLGKYDFDLAIAKFKKAVGLDPQTLKYRNEIIFSYLRLNQYKKAKNEAEKCLREQKTVSNTTELAMTYLYLMLIYDKLGDLRKALICKNRAENFGFRQGKYEWDNFRYATSLRWMADALYCWGQYDQSKAYYSKGLVFNSRMASDNRSLLLDLDMLCSGSDAWLKTGKIGKASEYIERAEKLLCSWVRGKSFRKAWMQNLKGRICELEGKFDLAGDEYGRAVEQLNGSIGSLHIISSVVYSDYSRCLDKGKLGGSLREQLGNSASACKNGVISKDNDKFNSTFAYARVAKHLGNHKTAIKFFKRAIKKYTVEFGRYSFKVFTAQKSLAKCYFALKRKRKTKRYIFAALNTYRHLGLPAYPELVTLYILYGDVLLMEKNTRESVKAYEKSLQLASQNFGSVNSLTEKVYRRLSKVYQQLKAYEKAIFYFNKHHRAHLSEQKLF